MSLCYILINQTVTSNYDRMTNYFTKKHFLQDKKVLLLKYTMLRIRRIGFFRLDENMVEIHEKH